MKRFLLVGGGRPLEQTARFLMGRDNALIVGCYAFGRFDGIGELVARPAESLLTEDGWSLVSASAPDWLISVNSTLVLPPAILAIPAHGSLNLHPGPLPEYPGLNVHQFALLNGEREYGVTIHWMEPRVDRGAIAASSRFAIGDHDTGLTLYVRAMERGTNLLLEVLAAILNDQAPPKMPQPMSEERRLFRRADLPSGEIDWCRPARSIVNLVRAGNYEPLTSPTFTAWMRSVDGSRIDVLRARIEGESGAAPGEVLAIDESGPLLAAGDGVSVRIARARRHGALIDAVGWEALIGRPRRLDLKARA